MSDLLDAVAKGQVRYLTWQETVVHQQRRDVVDVTAAFTGLQRAGLVAIQGYDLDNPPPSTPCLLTPAGEDAVMEAAAKARKNGKKAKR